MVLLSTSALPGKIMPLFTYLRLLQRGVIQPPNDCWICHDADEVPPITNFSLIFSASVSLKWPYSSLYHIRLPNTGGFISLSLIDSPKPGTSHPNSIQRKRHKARVTRKNKQKLCSLHALKIYWPSWLSSSSPKPDSKGNY